MLNTYKLFIKYTLNAAQLYTFITSTIPTPTIKSEQAYAYRNFFRKITS